MVKAGTVLLYKRFCLSKNELLSCAGETLVSLLLAFTDAAATARSAELVHEGSTNAGEAAQSQ